MIDDINQILESHDVAEAKMPIGLEIEEAPSSSSSALITARCSVTNLSGLSQIHVIGRRSHLKQFIGASGLPNQYIIADNINLAISSDAGVIFKRNLFESDKAVMINALNHLNVWRHIAQTNNELHLVLEDEAIFVDNWIEKWNSEYFPDLPSDAFDTLNNYLFNNDCQFYSNSLL